MIILYGGREIIVYIWQGRLSCTDERGESALLAFKIDNEKAIVQMFGISLLTLDEGKVIQKQIFELTRWKKEQETLTLMMHSR